VKSRRPTTPTVRECLDSSRAAIQLSIALLDRLALARCREAEALPEIPPPPEPPPGAP